MIRKFIIFIICTILFLLVCEGVGNGIYGQNIWSWIPSSSVGKDRSVTSDDDGVYTADLDYLVVGYYASVNRDSVEIVIEFVGLVDSIKATAYNNYGDSSLIVIDSAFIVFPTLHSNVGTEPNMHAETITESWVEATANYGIAHRNTLTSNDTVDATAPCSLNITTMVDSFYNEITPYYGFRIEGDVASGDNNGSFKSCENGTANQNPKMVVYFSEGEAVSTELTGILPKVYQGTIQPKVDAGKIVPKVRN